jgi:hypothetical protein
MAESVKVETKRGITVLNEEIPIPNPKKDPSKRLTNKLCLRFFLIKSDILTFVDKNKSPSRWCNGRGPVYFSVTVWNLSEPQ